MVAVLKYLKKLFFENVPTIDNEYNNQKVPNFDFNGKVSMDELFNKITSYLFHKGLNNLFVEQKRFSSNINEISDKKTKKGDEHYVYSSKRKGLILKTKTNEGTFEVSLTSVLESILVMDRNISLSSGVGYSRGKEKFIVKYTSEGVTDLGYLKTFYNLMNEIQVGGHKVFDELHLLEGKTGGFNNDTDLNNYVYKEENGMLSFKKIAFRPEPKKSVIERIVSFIEGDSGIKSSRQVEITDYDSSLNEINKSDRMKAENGRLNKEEPIKLVVEI